MLFAQNSICNFNRTQAIPTEFRRLVLCHGVCGLFSSFYSYLINTRLKGFAGRSTTVLASLVLLLLNGSQTLASDEYRITANEFEATRNAARLWVEYEQLPSTDIPLKNTDDARFARLWKQFGNAAGNVETAWTKAFERDSLLQRACACLDRYHDLDWQYGGLRKGIRREYGNDKFREFEAEGSDWIKTNGMPWLDLDDTNLVLLYLWRESMVDSEGAMQSTKLSPSSYEWLAGTEPYASEVVDEEILTEERAIEICRAAIIRLREQVSSEHNKIAYSLEMPSDMWRYFEIRDEAESMHSLGFNYLSVNLPKHTDISKAETNFNQMVSKIVKIRPDAMDALHTAHKAMLERKSQDLAEQYEAFEPSWQPQIQMSSLKLFFLILNVMVVMVLVLIILVRYRRKKAI